jgi:D-beta-D-heptose 7-phosphate kinase/D-beta-D-heptose 1-phosphate adenosyltransferase
VTRAPLVVIGDSLLDVDLDGFSDRLAPDAPVPVLDLARQSMRPGGAGLAALLAARAGAPVVLVTAIGRDEAGDTICGLLSDHLEVVALPLEGRTVAKTRIRSAGTPVLRVDAGAGRAANGPLPSRAAPAVAGAGALLVSDYGRGVAGHAVLRDLLASRPESTPLVWDPHPRGAMPVPHAAVVTPNEEEAQRVAPDPDDGARGRRLCDHWRAGAVAVTAGERGAILTQAGRLGTQRVRVPDARRAPAGERLDACGAGDRFAGALAEALRAGSALPDGVGYAVDQASAYVLGGGASAVSVGRDIRFPFPGAPADQVDALALARRVRRSGGRVVATGGCFDLLHRGHVSLLSSARGLGDALIVCLNSDASVRRAKGPMRPVVSQDDRARVLAALGAVDAVAIFDEDTPAELLELLRPDVWVKGTDYADHPMPEAEVVTHHGGQVVLLPTVPGYSTSSLVRSANLIAVR